MLQRICLGLLCFVLGGMERQQDRQGGRGGWQDRSGLPPIFGNSEDSNPHRRARRRDLPAGHLQHRQAGLLGNPAGLGPGKERQAHIRVILPAS